MTGRRRSAALAFALAAGLLAPGPAAAGPAAAAAYLRETPRLLGDAAGLRGRLEPLGVSLQLHYQQLWAWKPRGGTRRDGVTGHSASYDLLGRLDLEELLGARGLVAFLNVKGQYDRHPNETTGALWDVADDADFDEGIYLDQLWFEQGLLDGRLRLRAGLIEMQTVFDRNAFANREDEQFMNAALDNDPLVPLPDGLGAALIVRPRAWLEIAFGLVDADNVPRELGAGSFTDDADSLTGYAEAAVQVSLPGPDAGLPGSYRLGVFRDGGERTVFGRLDRRGRPRRDRGHLGGYLSFDQVLWRSERRAGRQLGWFARAAFADRDVARAEWFWSTGLEWAGAFRGRSDDALGLAIHQSIASSRYRAEVDDAFHRETGLEIYYRIALLPWLSFTPDLQYIVEPGAVSSAGDAVVTQLRVRVSF